MIKALILKLKEQARKQLCKFKIKNETNKKELFFIFKIQDGTQI